MLGVTFTVLLVCLCIALAIRGAFAIWTARHDKDNGASNPTATAETLAALLEGEDAPEATIEEKLDALALGLKNLRHRQSMLDGRLNKVAPPAEKGKGNGGAPPEEVRPLTRGELFKRWRESNARK